MWQTILLGAAIMVVVTAAWCIVGLRRNIAKAKASNLPYFISPFSPWFLPWQVTHKLLAPLIKMLPTPWWDPWLPPIMPDYSFINRHDHFARYGDAFTIVSPGNMHTFVSSPELIRQITSRREHFPKYTETYGILTQFGDNVLTSEGHTWRVHRKVTAPSFNERNAALVFRESIRQTLGMLSYWEHRLAQPEPQAEDAARHASSSSSPSTTTTTTTRTLRTVEGDTMRLALNIIGYAGFGLRLPWPHEELPDDIDPVSAKYASVDPPPGFHFSFTDAMAVLLENVLMLLLVPRWLLALLPYKSTREAVESRRDYEKFIDELLEEKIREARKGEDLAEGMDIMGQLVRSSYGDGREADGKAPTALSRQEITGNAFIMLVAGHETTANAIHFTLLQLAGNPAAQRRLHRDLDEVLADAPEDPREWDYDELLNPLMASMVGACMNETLRVLPPVIEMPKIVTPGQDQAVTMDGETRVLPAGAMVSLCAAAVHMHPRYWPARPSRVRPGQDDLHDYVPERWFRPAMKAEAEAEAEEEDEKQGGAQGEQDERDEKDDGGGGGGGFGGRDTSPQLFRPERGAYMPFSDGARACLGRRIAQVEVVAALAVLLRDHSVELGVEEWATDDEVEAMGRAERAEVFARARAARDETISKASSLLTLKLRGTAVPVRFVKRGGERFVDWMDE